MSNTSLENLQSGMLDNLKTYWDNDFCINGANSAAVALCSETLTIAHSMAFVEINQSLSMVSDTLC